MVMQALLGHEVHMTDDPAGWEARVVLVRGEGRTVLKRNVFATWFEADEWGGKEVSRYRALYQMPS